MVEETSQIAENRSWLSVSEGESVIWTGRPRIWRIVPTVAKAAVSAVVVLVAVAVFGPQFLPPSIPGAAVTALGVALALVALVPGVLAYLRTTRVDYVLTNRNVYKRVGVWSTTVTQIALTDIQNTELDKDVWGSLFDYGSVALSTAGSGGADVVFTDLESPETFRDELRQAKREARERSHDTDGAPGASALDARTVDRILADTRALREAAERLETGLMAR